MDNVTSELIKSARGWLADCVWTDMDAEDFAELPASVIIRGVRRHYFGGWPQFVLDQQAMSIIARVDA